MTSPTQATKSKSFSIRTRSFVQRPTPSPLCHYCPSLSAAPILFESSRLFVCVRRRPCPWLQPLPLRPRALQIRTACRPASPLYPTPSLAAMMAGCLQPFACLTVSPKTLRNDQESNQPTNDHHDDDYRMPRRCRHGNHIDWSNDEHQENTGDDGIREAIEPLFHDPTHSPLRSPKIVLRIRQLCPFYLTPSLYLYQPISSRNMRNASPATPSTPRTRQRRTYGSRFSAIRALFGLWYAHNLPPQSHRSAVSSHFLSAAPSAR